MVGVGYIQLSVWNMVPTVQFTKQMSTLPTNKKFGKLDPEFCMEQAHWIIKNIPCFEQDDITRVWRFHVDLSLIHI